MSKKNSRTGADVRAPAMNDNQAAATATILNPKQIALLKAIAAERQDASEAQAPLYRWLRETAEAGRQLPSFGKRPNLRQIGEEFAMHYRDVSKRFGAIINRWHVRFIETFPCEGQELPTDVTRLNEAVAGIGEGPERSEQLAAALRAAQAEAPAHQQKAYVWLIARAEGRQTIPVHSYRPNVSLIGKECGLSYNKARELTWLFVFWAKFFPTEKFPATVLRTALPGIEYEGTAVPTAMLVKRMKVSRAAEAVEDACRLLDHLIGVAEGDRTIPQFNKRPAFKTIMRSAGVIDKYKQQTLWRVCGDWLGFFRLDDNLTYMDSTGELKTRRNSRTEVSKHVQELRAAGLSLKRDRQHAETWSSAYLAEELNLTLSSVGLPAVREVLFAYVEECKLRDGGGDGLGEGWTPIRNVERKALEKAFRKDLLAYAKAEIDAGRPLPAHPVYANSLDYDEFVRRYGKSGPDMRENSTFRSELRKLNPRFARADAVGLPRTYGQLIDQYTQERLKTVNTEGSKAVIRSNIRTTIGAFSAGMRKTPADLIEDDFEEPGFEETLEAIIEADRVKRAKAEDWRRDMIKVAGFLASTQHAIDERFDVVVRNAIIATKKSYRELVEGTGMTEAQLRGWATGDTLPTRDEANKVAAIEGKLGLGEGRLASHIDPTRNHRAVAAAVPIPPRVREFLPDDYHKRPHELPAMIEWIFENLVLSGTDFGRRMSAMKLEESAKRKAAAEEAEANAPLPTPRIDLSKPVPVVNKALTAIFKRETRNLGKNVVAEMRELMVHMTEVMPTLDRRPKSFWQAGSTAPMKLRMLSRFFRWQIAPVEEGGLGRDAKHLTLGDLIHYPLVFAFIDFRARERARHEAEGRGVRKYFTGSDFDLVLTIRGLVANVYGFVTQNPDMAARITADHRNLSNGAFIGLGGHVYGHEENREADKKERSGVVDRRRDEIMPSRLCGLSADQFREACQSAERKYATAQEQIDKFAESGRDPAEAIKGILDADRPMETLLRQFAVATQRIPPVANGARRHHLHVRDLLMVRLLALTTLRSKNLRQITLTGACPKLREEVVSERKGKSPRVAGVPVGSKAWVLEIPYEEFKNYENAVLFGRRRDRQNYKKFLPNTRGLYSLLRYYIEVSRPFLSRNCVRASDALFVSSTGSALTDNQTWLAVRSATARWVAWNPFRNEGVEDVLPFGVHVFRDIRATDILLNPRTSNPFLEAALALQTSPGMIQSHYGVVKTEHRTAQDDLTFTDREADAWRGFDDKVFARMLDVA